MAGTLKKGNSLIQQIMRMRTELILARRVAYAETKTETVQTAHLGTLAHLARLGALQQVVQQMMPA
jgi:hypothetical protein